MIRQPRQLDREGERRMVQTEARQIERFEYAESPEADWVQDAVSLGESVRVVFPDVSDAELDWGKAQQSGRSEGFTQRFVYEDEAGLTSEVEDAVAEGEEGSGSGAGEEKQRFQQLLEAETSKAEERGHSRGLEAGLVLGHEEAGRALKSERDRRVAQAASLLDSFSKVRENYLHDLEREAAKLALAIAARILRREAQADPLLLTGAVRVALGQLAAATVVRLRVPVRDLAMWEESLKLMPGLALRPEVIGDDQMELGECRMETELGSADLGLWPQLKAIEKEFFERGDERGTGANAG